MTSLGNRNIMVIGSTGMLGSMVFDFFNNREYSVISSQFRWPSEDFKNEIRNFNGVIINCAGAIHQQDVDDYSINFELPVFLHTLNKKFIQPCTDCIYSGKIKPGNAYKIDEKPDAIDDYGYSKRVFAELIPDLNSNFKVIRTSIVGFDRNEVSLLSWFLNYSKSNSSCTGFTNHFWNGITTLQWARIAAYTIEQWDSCPKLIVPGTKPISKFELLGTIAKVFDVEILINKVSHLETKNKCLEINFPCFDIEHQLMDLRTSV